MLNLIYLTATMLIIWINIAGATTLLNRWFDDRNIARAAAVLGFVLVMFFIEHFVGLGEIKWMWPFFTAASLYVLHRKKDSMLSRHFLHSEGIFLIGFLYAFMWRFTFPDINPRAEEVTDLYFIANYLQGATLPPPDMWLADFKFNVYYAFQHYGAALMGRIVGLEIGYAYNFAWCVMLGLIASVSWSLAAAMTSRLWVKALVVAVVLIGGNGVSPLTHLMIDLSNYWDGNRTYVLESNIWTTIRFVGGFEDRMNTDLAVSLFTDGTLVQEGSARINEASGLIKEAFSGDFKRPVLSMETLSYLIYSGDFHPPVGGIFILLLALAIIARLETKTSKDSAKQQLPLQAFLAATIPLMLVINTWVFPLQLVLVGAWFVQRFIRKQHLDIKVMVAAGGVVTVMLMPFLSDFSFRSLGVSLVYIGDNPAQATPWGSVMLYVWPEIILAGLALFNRKFRALAISLIAVQLFAYIFTGFFYFDDLLGGEYERFNTVLKWWAWTHAMAMAAFAAMALSNEKLWQWLPAALVCVIMVGSYGYDLGANMLFGDGSNRGKMHGHQWFTNDQTNADMVKYLQESEDGRVLENIWGGAYNNTGRYALFAEKPMVLAWPSHLAGWRGSPRFLGYLENSIKDIYYGRAGRAEALGFLRENEVRYVIWSPEDNQNDQQDWAKIDTWLSPFYVFQPFYREGENRREKVGVWQLRKDITFTDIVVNSNFSSKNQ